MERPPEHTRSATALLLLTTRASRQSLSGMMASGLSSVRKINRLNINISVDAGELSALVVRCVDAPADSLRCVALEMRRGGGEKQEEEEEEREAGGEDVAYLRGSATMPI